MERVEGRLDSRTPDAPSRLGGLLLVLVACAAVACLTLYADRLFDNADPGWEWAAVVGLVWAIALALKGSRDG